MSGSSVFHNINRIFFCHGLTELIKHNRAYSLHLAHLILINLKEGMPWNKMETPLLPSKDGNLHPKAKPEDQYAPVQIPLFYFDE